MFLLVIFLKDFFYTSKKKFGAKKTCANTSVAEKSSLNSEDFFLLGHMAFRHRVLRNPDPRLFR